MTIRAKLYAAIVLTILGPLATTAVALHGMSQLGDRFDEVRERAEHEALAREIKFAVTDMNGWQTAYGYAGGEFRDRFLASAAKLRADLKAGEETFTDDEERALFEQAKRNFARFMDLDAVAWRSLQSGDPGRTKRILLGPELTIPDRRCYTDGKPWDVHNYADEHAGTMDLPAATANSVNTIFAQLVVAVGPDKVADAAQRMGVRSDTS